MFNNLRNGRPAKLLTDQFRTPISLKDASRIIAYLVKMDLKNETINLAGTERVSRYKLGEMLCSIADFDKNLLQKITTDEIPNYPKVEDVSLNTEKLQSLGLKTDSIEKNILNLIEEN